MEYILEFILELILEGSIEASKSVWVPKFIRYPLIVLIVLFFLGVFGLIFLTGILIIKKNFILGMFLILLSTFMLIIGIFKFRKTYLLKINEIEK